jgi:hypothetical protein
MNNYTTNIFFWTARNELEERWDYVKAWNKGWFPNKKSSNIPLIIGGVFLLSLLIVILIVFFRNRMKKEKIYKS